MNILSNEELDILDEIYPYFNQSELNPLYEYEDDSDNDDEYIENYLHNNNIH